MRHDINIIASNYKLNKDELRSFALANKSKYGIDDENGFITTSTSFTLDLVTDFKATLYTVNTPYGEVISIDEYMKTDDYFKHQEKIIKNFLTNKKQKELIDLFKK